MILLKYAARYAKGTLIAAAVMGVVGGTLSAWTVALVAAALRTGKSSATQILAFVGMALVGAALRFFSTDMLTRFSQRQMMERIRELSRLVVASGLRDVEELGSARLMATLTDDLIVITNTIALLPVVITHLAIFLACFIYVAWLSWQVWAIGTTCVALGVISYTWIMRRGFAFGREARSEHDALMEHYRALTDGFSELKLHRPRRTAFLARTLDASLEKIARLNVSALTLFNAAANYNQLIFFVVVGVLVFGAMRWTSADSATVTGAILALLYGRGPLETLVNMVPAVVRAEIALAKYESVVAQLPAEQAAGGVAPAVEQCAQIDLRGVEYQYTADEGEQFGLGPLDLTIRAGEILFVTGGNGSGKSTLAKIVAGLYVPMAGQMCVDGEPVTSANRDEYRQLVSSVFASFHLFRELLGLARPTLDRDAHAWLVRTRLQERLQVRDGRFSDLKLSTGQRKRVALVVSMLEDRPICIFDEWAADQDAQYREEFYASVLPELKAQQKIVIVISHDDRYYALGDRVIKLDSGKIVADQVMAARVAAPVPTLVRTQGVDAVVARPVFGRVS